MGCAQKEREGEGCWLTGRDTLDTATAGETTDGGLGYALDVVTENLSVALGSAFAETLSTFSACCGHASVCLLLLLLCFEGRRLPFRGRRAVMRLGGLLTSSHVDGSEVVVVELNLEWGWNMGLVGSGWIELIAVDGGCKRSYPGRYLKQFPRQMLIDLRSTLNRF